MWRPRILAAARPARAATLSRRAKRGNGNPQSGIGHPPSGIKARLLAVGLVLWAGGLFGCAQSLPPRQYFLLSASHPPAAPGAAGRGVLQVRAFRVNPAFAGRQLVYRVGPYRYETDYYHQYLTAPGAMLAERTRDWLSASGLFEEVVTPSSALPATYALTGDVLALYGDFAGPGAPTGVLEIRFSLLGPAEGKEAVVFTHTYEAASPVTRRTAEAVVAALSADLEEILTQLEGDLRRRIGEADGS